MGKKYFTKYLSIEGEIKGGEKYRDASGSIHICSEGGFTGHTKGKIKVKLFLCSRDIQVGDRAYFFENNKIFSKILTKEEVKFGFFQIDEYEYQIAVEDCGKIVGEISPRAKWVKEGMEFDEDEWREIDDSNRNYNELYIAIKCPNCEQFH